MGYLPKKFISPVVDANVYELALPISFTKNLKGLTNLATLRRKNTYRVWQVTVQEYHLTDDTGFVQRGYKFCEGWRRFRDENNAEYGDFFIFEYPGNSVFSVIVMGRNGCEKYMEPGPRPPCRSQIRGPCPAAEDWGEDSTAAKCFLRHSMYPNFMVKLTSAYMVHGVVNIPFVYANTNLPDKEDMEAIVKVKGVNWRVMFSMYYREGKAYNCKISSGFKDVIDGAKLRLGNVLAFEQLNLSPLTYLVIVFKTGV